MADVMNLGRFEALVAAYGATPSRWPEEERDAAAAFARADPAAAALLAEADRIDALLFAHRVANPSRALRAMVIEGAPRRSPLVSRARLWWTAIAFALAAGGGAFAGSAATAALDPASAHLQLYDQNDMATYDEAGETYE
jgi:hypothetical protein